MKKLLLTSSLIILLVLMGTALRAQPAPDIQKHPTCKYCGMDREKFNFSRMLTSYSDGSEFGSCSIHCTAIEFALSLDKISTAIQVGDYNSKKLIDAEKAQWVISGNKPGVMTKNAKWAFADNKDATAFIKENGGKLGSFDDAMKASFEDMYADIKMIRAKRAQMREMKQEKKP